MADRAGRGTAISRRHQMSGAFGGCSTWATMRVRRSGVVRRQKSCSSTRGSNGDDSQLVLPDWGDWPAAGPPSGGQFDRERALTRHPRLPSMGVKNSPPDVGMDVCAVGGVSVVRRGCARKQARRGRRRSTSPTGRRRPGETVIASGDGVLSPRSSPGRQRHATPSPGGLRVPLPRHRLGRGRRHLPTNRTHRGSSELAAVRHSDATEERDPRPGR